MDPKPLKENKWCDNCGIVRPHVAVARNVWATFFVYLCLRCQRRTPYEV